MAEPILQSQFGGDNMFSSGARAAGDAAANTKSFLAKYLSQFMPKKVIPPSNVDANGVPVFGMQPKGVVQSVDSAATVTPSMAPELFTTPKKSAIASVASSQAPSSAVPSNTSPFVNGSVYDGGMGKPSIGSQFPSDAPLASTADFSKINELYDSQIARNQALSDNEKAMIKANAPTGTERILSGIGQVANIAAPIASYMLGAEQNKMIKDQQNWERGRVTASDRRKSEFAKRAGGTY